MRPTLHTWGWSTDRKSRIIFCCILAPLPRQGEGREGGAGEGEIWQEQCHNRLPINPCQEHIWKDFWSPIVGTNSISNHQPFIALRVLIIYNLKSVKALEHCDKIVTNWKNLKGFWKQSHICLQESMLPCRTSSTLHHTTKALQSNCCPLVPTGKNQSLMSANWGGCKMTLPNRD